MEGFNFTASRPDDDTSTMSDNDVLLSADEFTQLVAQSASAVYRMLHLRYRMLSQADIEDVVAEATAKLWEHRDAYSKGKPFFPLFYVVSKRTAIDWIRKTKDEPVRHMQFMEDVAIALESYDGEAEDSTKTIQDLRRLFRELSPIEQRILEASVMFSESTTWAKHLSDELKLSPGNLRVRRVRIIRKLKQQLNKLGYPAPR